jgi:hypothetical protein
VLEEPRLTQQIEELAVPEVHLHLMALTQPVVPAEAKVLPAQAMQITLGLDRETVDLHQLVAEQELEETLADLVEVLVFTTLFLELALVMEAVELVAKMETELMPQLLAQETLHYMVVVLVVQVLFHSIKVLMEKVEGPQAHLLLLHSEEVMES